MALQALDTVVSDSDLKSTTSDEKFDDKLVQLVDFHEEIQAENIGSFENLTSQVNANLSNCQDAQFGARFIGENITLIFGESQRKTAKEKVLSENVEYLDDEERKITKTYKWYLQISVSLVLLIICLIIFYLTAETINNKEKLEKLLDKKTNFKNKNGADTFDLEQTNFSLFYNNSVINVINTTAFSTNVIKPRKHSEVKELNKADDKTFLKTLYGTTQSDITIRSENKPTTVKQVKNATADPLIHDITTQFKTIPHLNERVLILSKISSSPIDVIYVTRSRYFTSKPFHSVSKIRVEFNPAICVIMPNCLKELSDYPDIDYNFVLVGSVLYVGRGWTFSVNPEETVKLLIVLRSSKSFNEKQMYHYLLLVNASVRCDYVYKNFTVEIDLEKHHTLTAGYNKFIDIINASEQEKYYVDDRVRFESDSTNLIVKIKKYHCPLLATCNSTCEQQGCLQRVCEISGLCFVQCM